jgi:hypothetical protein
MTRQEFIGRIAQNSALDRQHAEVATQVVLTSTACTGASWLAERRDRASNHALYPGGAPAGS